MTIAVKYIPTAEPIFLANQHSRFNPEHIAQCTRCYEDWHDMQLDMATDIELDNRIENERE